MYKSKRRFSGKRRYRPRPDVGVDLENVLESVIEKWFAILMRIWLY